MMKRDEILSALNDIVAIPTCAHKAQAMLDNPNADLGELSRIIEHDPGLTINLLKISNASFYGSREAIRTTEAAIMNIGDLQMLQFVISTGVAPCFVDTFEGYDLSPSMLLQHSVSVAMAARDFGRTLGVDMPDHVFTAGLLSGVGKTVLGAYTDVNGREISEFALKKGLSFDQAEDQLLGINHAEIGARLLTNWGLPKDLINVVRHHIDPDGSEEDSIVLDLVHLGHVLAKMIGVGLGVDGLNYTVCQSVIDRLRITPDVVDVVSANVVVELGSVWDLFIACTEEPVCADTSAYANI